MVVTSDPLVVTSDCLVAPIDDLVVTSGCSVATIDMGPRRVADKTMYRDKVGQWFYQ